MRTLFLSNLLLLVGAIVFCSAVRAQNSGAPAGLPDAPPKPAGPIPGPAHDPHDLVGVWNVKGSANGFGRVPPLTPYGEQLYKEAKSSNSGEYTLKDTNDPVITKCYPPGTPRIYLQPFPWQIVQAPKEIIFIYEYDHTVRHIFTDGRKHPADITPTYMGDSIGSWDGDTFVVDTVGFNERTWVDRLGHGHSDQLHVIERFHRVNLNDLELDLTMEDPKTLAAPWNGHLQFQLHPDWTLEELVCTDNGDFLSFEK